MSISTFSLNSRELPKEYVGARAKKQVGNNNPTRFLLARLLGTLTQGTPVKLRIHLQWGWGKIWQHNMNNFGKIGTIGEVLETIRYL